MQFTAFLLAALSGAALAMPAATSQATGTHTSAAAAPSKWSSNLFGGPTLHSGYRGCCPAGQFEVQDCEEPMMVANGMYSKQKSCQCSDHVQVMQCA